MIHATVNNYTNAIVDATIGGRDVVTRTIAVAFDDTGLTDYLANLKASNLIGTTLLDGVSATFSSSIDGATPPSYTITNVSLINEAVPEPASWGLLILGMSNHRPCDAVHHAPFEWTFAIKSNDGRP